MGFTKKSKVRMAKSIPMYQYNGKTVVENIDGQVVQRTIYENEPLEEVGKTLVDRDDYSLEALLAAGVPLEQLPIGSLLNPTDFSSIDEIRDSISLDAYTELLNHQTDDISVKITDEIVDTQTPKE